MDALLHRLDPSLLTEWGYRAMIAAVAGGIALIAGLVWWNPVWVFFVPFLLLPALLVPALVRRPLVHLTVVLAGFAAISGHQPGLQVQEILYGLYYLSYLGCWFAYRFMDRPGRLIERPEDKALAFFLIYGTGTVALTVLFGGKLSSFGGEWLSLSMLGFYWPVREACRESQRGTRWMIGILVWLAIFGAVRNLIFFQEALQSAEQMWQILRGRIKLNEIFFVAGSVTGIVLALYSSRARYRLASIVLFGVSFASLVLTRSRGYWAAFALALLVIFYFVDTRKKVYTVSAGFVGLGGFVAIGALFFPAYFELVTASLIQRLSTFTTAFTQDVSLINRFYETREVLRQFVKNPILGYGMGTPYSYFYLIPTGKFTMEWAFIHNGYAGLLYKFGLLGFTAMAIFYLKSVWNGIRLIRTANAPRYDRAAALICVAFLISELLVANTSNPWIMSDGNLMIAVTAAIATGARERAEE